MIEQPSKKTMMLFAGSSNIDLSEEVAEKLGTNLIPIESKKFASGELYVRLNESARGGDCFVMQSHSGDLNSTIM
ncbi:MAG: ribose-phosphate pyrophosphokinase, partial [Candidatus Actinomarinales bacterium]